MVIYTCSTCLKEFKQKSHYNTHSIKKNKCDNIINLIVDKSLVNKSVVDDITLIEKIELNLNNNNTIAFIEKMNNMEDIKKLQKTDLLIKCKNLNIEKCSTKTKSQLISMIETKLNEINNPPNVINTNIIYEKPIIKWVGGKTQIIDKIIENFPSEINNYHELFLGGGSVLLALLQNIETNKIKVHGSINAYDINETLINLYKNIQNKSSEVLVEIKKYITIYNNLKGDVINRKPKTLLEGTTSQESYFYWIRTQFNKLKQENKNTPLGTAYFIFLNKTCFRGVYREGPNGFNVPFGHYSNPEIINEEHIKKISKLIKNVNFYCSSFEKSFEKINENDFIYLDPPYAPENEKSFVGYTSAGFNLEQHNLLFSICKKHKFLMSNADVDLVKNNFKDNKYTVKIISCKRSINSKKPDAKTNEVLIKSY
jgi:DNA adenine methylase